MSRAVLKIICIVSGVLVIVFGILTVHTAMQMLQTVVNVGVIGSSGAPTIQFVLQSTAKTPVFSAAIVALFLFVGTGLGLIFSRKNKV